MKPSEKILIVDDDPTNVKLLAAKLSDSEYTLLKAYSGEEALHMVKSHMPDLVLLDIMMPGINGLEVAARLKNDPATVEIPIILVTALDGADNKTKGLEAGADDFLNKPVHTAELKARVKSLLRLKRYSDQLKSRAHAKGTLLNPYVNDDTSSDLRLPHLLIVEDSLADAKLIKSHLHNMACSITIVHSGEEALSVCSNHIVDIVVLDMLLPGLDGYHVARQIKENESTRSTQIIVVTSLQDMESKIRGYEFGVDDYLVKPINFSEFRARVNSLIKKKAYYDNLMNNFEVAVQAAITDKLTGLYNSAYFLHYLKNELKRSDRKGFPVCLLMLDIDDFKRINDRYGHMAGDKALKEIGAVLLQSAREVDILARYGGDEFAILLSYSDLKEAMAVAERLRQGIIHAPLMLGNNEALMLSISIGIAEYLPGQEPKTLLHKADEALYAAKSSGKNRVVASPTDR